MLNIITKTCKNLAFNTKYLGEFATQILFPANCVACNVAVAKMGAICAKCFTQMQVMQPPECSKANGPVSNWKASGGVLMGDASFLSIVNQGWCQSLSNASRISAEITGGVP